MPDILKSQRGVVPVLILLAVTTLLTAGGVYVVKNNLLQSQKVLSSNISLTSNSSTGTSNITSGTPTFGSGLSVSTTTYKPSSKSSTEPQFSITPPAGWIKVNGKDKTKLRFDAPKIDRKENETGNGTFYVESTATIQVTMEKSTAANLEGAIKNINNTFKLTNAQVEFVRQEKTTIAGNEAYYFEAVLSLPSVNYLEMAAELKSQNSLAEAKNIQATLEDLKAHMAGYLIYSNGYEIGIGASSLAAAWPERAEPMLSSIGTFKLIGQANAPTPTLTPVTNFWLKASPQPVPNIDVSPLGKDWRIIFKDNQPNYSTLELLSTVNPYIEIDIQVKRLGGRPYDQIIRSYKDAVPSRGLVAIKEPITVNGIRGSILDYRDNNDPTWYYTAHYYEFVGVTDNFEIDVRGRTAERIWDKYSDLIKKAVESVKIGN